MIGSPRYKNCRDGIQNSHLDEPSQDQSMTRCAAGLNRSQMSGKHTNSLFKKHSTNAIISQNSQHNEVASKNPKKLRTTISTLQSQMANTSKNTKKPSVNARYKNQSNLNNRAHQQR